MKFRISASMIFSSVEFFDYSVEDNFYFRCMRTLVPTSVIVGESVTVIISDVELADSTIPADPILTWFVEPYYFNFVGLAADSRLSQRPAIEGLLDSDDFDFDIHLILL